MPFRIPEAIKKFDFKLSDAGQPLANVILLGGVRYVEVCPCCSCIHQLPIRHEGDTYTPRCLVKEWGRPDYLKWIVRFPDAAKHTRVQLIGDFSPKGEKTAVPDSTSNTVVKPDSPAQIAPYAENLRKPEISPIPTGQRTRRKNRESIPVPS